MTALVFLERDEPLPPYEFGREIARAAGLPLADVTRAIRDARGILFLGLDLAGSESVARRLTAVGRRAKGVPVERVPPLPRPRKLLDADPTAEGILIQAVQGPSPGLVPWRQVRLAAAGTVTFELPPGLKPRTDDDMDRVYAGVHHLHFQGASREFHRLLNMPEPPAPRTETLDVLDLVLEAREDRFRIVSKRFRYDYLGEEIALASTENFRRLIEDIADLAPETLLTGSTLSFLENARPGTHHFRTQVVFEAYLRWADAWHDVWTP